MHRAVIAASAAVCLWTSACSSADAPPPPAPVATDVARDLGARLASAPAATGDAGLGYTWPIPAGWIDDFYTFPLPFAPSLPYAGVEALRQAPGFADPKSPEYWSYTFAFWLEGDPKITDESLARDMTAYYLGLAAGCKDPSFPCDASRFHGELTTLFQDGGVRVFGGTVASYDMFFTGNPITLSMLVSTYECRRDGHRVVLFSASPAPFTSPVWREILERQLEFRCG